MQWAVQAAKGGIPVTKTWRYRIDMHSTALNTQTGLALYTTGLSCSNI